MTNSQSIVFPHFHKGYVDITFSRWDAAGPLVLEVHHLLWRWPLFVHDTHTVFNKSKWLNCSLWPTDVKVAGGTTLGQSGPRKDGNKGILHIPQSSRIGASSSDVVCHIQETHWRGLTHLQKCNQSIPQPQPTGLYFLFWRSNLVKMKKD